MSASSSVSSVVSTSSVAASASTDIPVADTEAAVAFSAADISTSQGWGAGKQTYSKSNPHKQN